MASLGGDAHDAVRRALGGVGQDRLHRLHGGHDLAIGGEIVVAKRAHLVDAIAPPLRRPAELDVRHLLDEPAEDLDAVAALRAVAPRLDERRRCSACSSSS